MPTRRATLIVETHGGDADRLRLEGWLARWESRLAHCSENLGCGCCVDIYEVEAPAEALDELPGHFLGGSDWSDGATPRPPGFADRFRTFFRPRHR